MGMKSADEELRVPLHSNMLYYLYNQMPSVAYEGYMHTDTLMAGGVGGGGGGGSRDPCCW